MDEARLAHVYRRTLVGLRISAADRAPTGHMYTLSSSPATSMAGPASFTTTVGSAGATCHTQQT